MYCVPVRGELTLLLLLLLVCRYDDDSSCSISGWSARSQLDCLIDQQVQSAVVRAIAGKPCAALQHLAVNMETMSQQAYPEGWFARVAAALQLTADQKAVLRAVWGKAAADRASLLAQHEMLTKQLLALQQQQAARVQEFGARVLKASERCLISMQKQAWQCMQAMLVPGTSATAATVGTGGASYQAVGTAQGISGTFSISSGSLTNNARAQAAAAAATVYRSSTPVGGCSSSCSGSSSSTASTASAAAAAALFSNTAALAGVTRSNQLLQQPQGSIRTSLAAAAADGYKILSMTCSVRGPEAAAAAADSSPLGLACHPEVLLCEPRPGQQQLQQKLAAVRGSLGVLHTWCSLVCYNTLSRKQLAVAAVTSYPFAFDPMAGEQCGPVRSVNLSAAWW
jgi:hypothetical protein